MSAGERPAQLHAARTAGGHLGVAVRGAAGNRIDGVVPRSDAVVVERAAFDGGGLTAQPSQDLLDLVVSDGRIGRHTPRPVTYALRCMTRYLPRTA